MKNFFKLSSTGKRTAFSLTEIMITISLISIIAGFSIPAYTKTFDRSRARIARAHLTSIYNANLIYRAQNGDFWDTSGANVAVAAINTNLNLNIVEEGFIYTYSYNAGVGSWVANATHSLFALQIVGANPVSATNPSCSAGTCPAP